MSMQLWELKEAVDKLVTTHGDSVWIDMKIEFKDSASGGLHAVINEVDG